VARLLSLAQNLALERPGFFDIKGPNVGDKDAAAFMAALRVRAADAFGADFAEQTICGQNRLCVDYYFRGSHDRRIAMGLRNPNSEFERDVLKAIMAQDAGHTVRHLAFIAKPGATKKCSQPSARAHRLGSACARVDHHRARDFAIVMHPPCAECDG
jgi:hypothetical protein